MIRENLKKSGLDSLDEYEQLLRADSSKSRGEWNALISIMTVGESHFFRDLGQFKLLREHILPELIAGAKARQSLRIWSAGCATGEEPLSLAILIDELLPDKDQWHLHIIGTDINDQAIAKARRGIFGEWSFRNVSSEERTRYFTRRGDAWKIIERIHRMAVFRTGNLLDPRSNPAGDENSMDLIVCRNVLIYFNQEAAACAVDNLVKTPAPGGYLMAGHGELMNLLSHAAGLMPEIHAESVVYRKADDSVSPSRATARQEEPLPVLPQESEGSIVEKRTGILPGGREIGVPRPSASALDAPRPVQRVSPEPTAAPADRSVRDALRELHGLFRNKDYGAVIEKGVRLIVIDPRNLVACGLVARSYANQGLYEKASELCRKMMEIDDHSVTAHFLMANLAEAQEEYEEAKRLLKRVVYLQPTFAPAYIELSGIYARENDTRRSQMNRRAAVELLKSLPPDTVIDQYENVTAGELISYLQDTNL